MFSDFTSEVAQLAKSFLTKRGLSDSPKEESQQASPELEINVQKLSFKLVNSILFYLLYRHYSSDKS